jgi:shikimate kinase
MGSGKSTVGAWLAEKLGWDFIDLDTEIVQREGRSIAETFRQLGELRFRQIESEVLRHVLQAADGPRVIALGGGTFIQSGNREVLRAHGAQTIYLEADFELLLSRCCTEEGTRPLMQDPLRFRRLFDERLPIYRSASAVVQVAGKTPQEIASEIAALREQLTARPAVPE